MKQCELCKREFQPKDQRVIFCSRTCGAKWKWTQPDIVRAMMGNRDNVAMGKKVSAAIMQNLAERQARSDRARAQSPATRYAALKKSWIKRRLNGEKAFKGHGNGCPPSQAESVLLALFPEAMHDPAILSHRGAKSFDHKTGYQHYYKPDLGWLRLKLAVEADGEPHTRPRQIIIDRKKDEVLRSLGWTVLRFTNEEIIHNTTRVQEVIQSTISKLQATQVTAPAVS